MELRQLTYFVTVAELRHFGRAAEALSIVQPAVSQQIARLERELGLVLFDRSRRQIALTAEGEAFLPHARRVLRARDRAVGAAADIAAGASGLLRVGSSEGLGQRLEQILAAFRRRRPAVLLELIPGLTPAKLAAVAAGDLDAAFVRAARLTAGVVVHPLWDEPLLLAVPAERASATGDAIDLAALADLPLAQTPRSANPGVFDLVAAGCHAAGFTPLSGPTLGSVQDLLAGHVAAGRCWTVLYASTAAMAPHDVTLRPAQPALRVPTGLAVPDPPRRALVDELLVAARTS
ncbi:MAG: LysR family transcriptional regulator [Pseudonocardiales bacterium]|nr:MAG: LysR family transcriptional regulator [Pseudonocardiales bacterium]